MKRVIHSFCSQGWRVCKSSLFIVLVDNKEKWSGVEVGTPIIGDELLNKKCVSFQFQLYSLSIARSSHVYGWANCSECLYSLPKWSVSNVMTTCLTGGGLAFAWFCALHIPHGVGNGPSVGPTSVLSRVAHLTKKLCTSNLINLYKSLLSGGKFGAFVRHE